MLRAYKIDSENRRLKERIDASQGTVNLRAYSESYKQVQLYKQRRERNTSLSKAEQMAQEKVKLFRSPSAQSGVPLALPPIQEVPEQASVTPNGKRKQPRQN